MDRQAFEHVYREQVARVYRYCLFRTGDASIAEDLTAETFARLFSANGRVTGARIEPWLLRVASNLSIDESRRKARFTNEPLPEVAEAFPDGRVWIDTDVRDAMSELSCVQQQVVYLRLIEDMAFADVARAMGRREPSTRVLYGRALKALRGALERGER